MPVTADHSPSFPARTAGEVVITGVGIITAMGCGWEANAAGFRVGRVALRPVTVFDVSRQVAQIAGEVALPATLPANRLSRGQLRRMERGGKMLLHAASEALVRAKVTAAMAPATLEIVLGTSVGAMTHGEEFYRQITQATGSRRGQVARVIEYLIPQQGGLLARAFDLVAPTTVISNACASGANALGHAYHLIRGGRSEMVIVGGYDALCQMVYAGFDSLRALSRTRPKPFDAARDGLALGEGAAVFVLERRAHALARGAEIIATVAGYGVATDCHHLTQPHPAGLAALQSMRMACHEAGLEPRQIQYLNSHGTGTLLNDPAEAAAIAAWAGAAVSGIAVSSTKGAIGHLLGGAGAVEAAICLMAMTDGFLPATAHVTTPDPCCTFELVTRPRPATLHTTLSNSFGFGGSNASLIFQRGDANDAHRLPRQDDGHRPSRSLTITGIGAVSPAGWGVAALVAALAAGHPLLETWLTPPAAAANNLCPHRVRAVPRPVPDRAMAGHPRLRRATPVALFAAAAALEALGPARVAAVQAGTLRAGLIYTLLNGGVSYCGRFCGEVLANPATASPILFPETVFNAPASHLAAYLGIGGPCTSLVGDSAQFLAAIDLAALWLDLGHIDLCLVVGAEENDWLAAAAIALLKLGVPAAEGAACLVIEPGGPGTAGVAIEALTTRHPIAGFAQRQQAAAAARAALGAINPAALLVDDRCGHPASDAATARAWPEWSGPRWSPATILGHGLSAAGAWQCVAACHSLRSGAATEAIVVSTGISQRACALHLRQHDCQPAEA
ncbi:MAG: beta-ketoacyl-[acyl-carrier-protein] synthase family protein [Verrucomicrobia bacterium]|nr:beta-ketoacyl-[acyl-carrier-protein] synthase family protein [Verrucomicrobiota bacterium]